jgi:hypothetical protein
MYIFDFECHSHYAEIEIVSNLLAPAVSTKSSQDANASYALQYRGVSQ